MKNPFSVTLRAAFTMHRFLRPLAFALACWACGVAAQAQTQFFTTSQGLISTSQAFEGVFLRNSGFASFSDSGNEPGRVEAWNASADLPGGQIRMEVSALLNAGQTPQETALTNVIAGFGDTIGFSGSGGGNVTAQLTLSGSFFTSAPGASTITNESYLRIAFLQPGSFNGNVFAAGNVIAQTIWGLGAGAVPSPFLPSPAPFTEVITAFPRTLTSSAPISSLPQGFQVVVVLQTGLEGDSENGAGLSWNVDLGDTVNVQLMAPQGYTLSTSGGLPVPEPSTCLLSLAGLAGLSWRRHRAG